MGVAGVARLRIWNRHYAGSLLQLAPEEMRRGVWENMKFFSSGFFSGVFIRVKAFSHTLDFRTDA